MNRLKGALREKTRRAEGKDGRGGKKTKAIPRKFGDFRFDYMRTCRHDLTSANQAQCPVCLMADRISCAFLKEERAARAHNRIESTIRRANLRYELLSGWAHNQGIFVEGMNDAKIGCEIVFSGPVALSMIRTCESWGMDFAGLQKLLELRLRLLQIGQEAATFIQCRVRKWLIKRRVRRFMLKRFVWEPSTRMRAQDSWVDTHTQKRYFQNPVLLRHERPASPRAIQRRLNSEKNKVDLRSKVYQEWLPRIKADDRYGRYATMIRDLRQLVLLQDVIEVGMKYLRMAKILDPVEEKEKEKNSYGQEEQEGAGAENADEEEKEGQGDDGDGDGNGVTERKQKREKKEASAVVDFFPSMSAPFPPLRQIALAMALDTEPMKDPEPVAVAVAAKSSSSKNKKVPRAPKVVKISLNHRFVELERRRWEAMRCTTSADVLKMLLHDENHPCFCSILHIASDEYEIWHSHLDPKEVTSRDMFGNELTETGELKETEAVAVDDANEAANTLEGEAEHADVLPIFAKLHRFPPADRGPNGHFRLFFLNGQLAAASQASSLAYYEEVKVNRDAVRDEIISFAKRRDVHKLLAKASKSQEERRERVAPLGNRMLASKIRDKIVSLYAPAEKEVYGTKVELIPDAEMLDEDLVAAGEKYPFLLKLSEFHDRYKKAKKRIRTQRNAKTKKKKKAPAVATFDDFDFSEANVQKIDLTGGRTLVPKFEGAIEPLPVQVEMAGAGVFASNVARAPGGAEKLVKLRDRCIDGLRHNSLKMSKEKAETFGLVPMASGDLDLVLPPDADRVAGEEIYREALAQLMSVTETGFQDRITNDKVEELLEEARKGAHEETPALIYDLGVLDVTINLDDKPMQAQLLEFVGMFSSQMIQPPPSLDLGLLEWNIFYRTHAEAMLAQDGGEEDEEMKRLFNTTGAHPVLGHVRPDSRERPRSRGAASGGAAGDSRPGTGIGWMEPVSAENIDSSSDMKGSGVAVFKKEVDGRMFEFRVLAEPMSAAYVESHFPAGLCRWVGLERKVPSFRAKRED